jgi:hypothetical protein
MIAVAIIGEPCGKGIASPVASPEMRELGAAGTDGPLNLVELFATKDSSLSWKGH